MKKSVSFILILATLLGVLSMFAFSASAAEVNTVTVKTDGYYEIANVGNGLYLNVYGSRSANNTALTSYRRDFTRGQSFHFVKNGQYFAIVPRCATSKVVNIYTSTVVKQNNKVCLWSKTGNATQLWTVKYDAANDAFLICSASDPNYVLTATGSSNSSAIQMRRYQANNKNQLWRSDAFRVEKPASTVQDGKITTAQIQAVLDKYGYKTGMYWTVKETRNGNDCSAKSQSWTTPLYATKHAASANGSYKSYNFSWQYECHGFATYVMSNVTGTTVRPTYNGGEGWTKIAGESKIKELKVGDIIRTSGHTAIVLSVDANGVCTFAEAWGSVGCKINIGKFNGKYNTLSQLKSAYQVEYVYRYVG